MKPNRRISTILFLLMGLISVLTFQQCSDVNLRKFDGVALFASTGFPLLMKAPTQYPAYRRYVLLVDMSNSMIAGPCPFDRDVDDSVHGYTSKPAPQWDPNPTKNDPAADPNDGRTLARDCKVNPGLVPPQMVIDRLPAGAPFDSVPVHQTYPGADPNADRITVTKTWIDQLRTNLPTAAAQRTMIMLMPVTGGSAQMKLEKGYPLKPEFVNLFDPRIDQALNHIQGKHTLENTLVRMDVLPRWLQTLSLDTTMGTTSSGEMLTRIYSDINNNYRTLALAGELTGTTFDVILFGDGHITPLASHFTRTKELFYDCNCSGALCTAQCSQLEEDMKASWGDPDANRVEAVDLRFSVLQAMPRFYGGGFLDAHLVQINPEHYKLRTNNGKSEFETLVEMSRAREAKLKHWKMLGPNPPFQLAANRSTVTTFKMTHLFLLNPNARVNLNGQVKADSDGDGLPDDEESALSVDPLKARTDGYCLDSIAANPTFGPRCAAMKTAKACDPTLDSDGDSLNECEEMILGTDPYDLDTDGDALPDTLEWLYGFNPLRADTEMDTNGDGFNNMIAFAAGLPPQLDFQSVAYERKIQFQSTYLGQQEIDDIQMGKVRVDSYDVKIDVMPAAQLQAVDPAPSQGELYLNRLVSPGASRANSFIHPGHRLIKSVTNPRKNLIMGLLRTIDPDDPRRVYWQILEMPFDLAGVNGQKQVDLSAFEQIRVSDRQQEGN